MKKTTVYFIRHAEAEGNVYRRCHGTYDSHLTPRAYEQLTHLAARFTPVSLSAVYASPLFRARTTAHAIADPKGLEVQLDARLQEVSMGDWEDLTWGELEALHTQQFDDWQQNAAFIPAPGGETATQAGERMLSAAKGFAMQHLGESIAVVTHGTAIRSALCAAHGLGAAMFARMPWGDNTCVAKIDMLADGTMDVIYENDASHLPEALSTFAHVDLGQTRSQMAINIWFRPVRLDDADDKLAFLRLSHAFYEETDTPTLSESTLLEQAERLQDKNERNVCLCISKDFDAPIGLLMLDMTASDSQHGEVSLLYLIPEARGNRYVHQMLGHATSVYRNAGKAYLRLTLPESCARLLPLLHAFGLTAHEDAPYMLTKQIIEPLKRT